MTCASCGAPVPEGARFCPSCGQILVVRPDERRLATVLFADLVGFTTFSEAADPEHVKNLVDSCFDRLAADVTAFGGQVDKIVGDELMALFGAPVAHEDDPERAVRAALALQESMEAFCAEHGVRVQLRIGVNTGEVLVGGLRAGDDYTAMGDAVNIASRLQAAAAPGEVLVGADTYAATQAAIVYEPAGSLAIRGRERPIETWIARAARTRPGWRAARGDRPLVGREDELAMMRQSVISAHRRRRALLLLIVGEAGVGKSRMAREVARSIESAGATVLAGQCVPYGETNVWSPVGDAIGDALGIESPTIDEHTMTRVVGHELGMAPVDEEALRIAAGLASVMGRSEVTAEVDPGRAHDERLRAVHLILETFTERAPVVLALSDLHWADEAVFDLVDSLLTRLAQRPFVLVATARPELAEHWHPSVRHETSVLHLDPLDDEATTRLIRSHLGPGTSDAAVELLLERSGGNPFFIEELAALAAESDVDLHALAVSAAPDDRIRAMPATLRGLVAARLDALDERARGVLEDCAVAGSERPLELPEALGASRGEQDVSGGLHTLAERDLLRVTETEYEFRSELVREIAYGTLTKAERARRHALVAAWVDERGGGGEETERLEQLAMHYGTAAELAHELGGLDALPSDLLERAIDAHDAAAGHAERSEVWPRVARHLEAAITLAGADDPRHVERLLGLVRARVERHRLDEARDDLERASELAGRARDPGLDVQALLVRGLFEHRGGRFHEAVAAYDAAVERARELADERSIADGLRGRGLALMFRGDLDEAEEAIEPALEIFRRIGDRRGEAWALQNLAWIAFYRAQPSLADERLTPAIEMFTELRDWGGLDWALGLYAWVRFTQGHLAEARELAERVLTHSDESGDHWALGMLSVLLAQVALWTGHPERAIDRSLEAQERFERLDDAFGIVQSLIPRARALACLGRLDEAHGALETMTTAASRSTEDVTTLPPILAMSIGGHLGEAAWLERYAPTSSRPVRTRSASSRASAEELGIGGALARLQAGEVDAARTELERSYEEASSESAAAAAGGLLAMARAAAGDAQASLALTDELVELEVGSYLDRLEAWMARALAAAQLGQGTSAHEAADRAVELADATESTLDQALTRLARATVLAHLGNEGTGTARADAEARLEWLGVTAVGWALVFRLATQGAGTPATSR